MATSVSCAHMDDASYTWQFEMTQELEVLIFLCCFHYLFLGFLLLKRLLLKMMQLFHHITFGTQRLMVALKSYLLCRIIIRGPCSGLSLWLFNFVQIKIELLPLKFISDMFFLTSDVFGAPLLKGFSLRNRKV